MSKTTLNLRLEKGLDGRQVANGAIANVYPVSTTLSSEENKALRNIIIPAGSGPVSRSVDVNPGRYLIEAKLPSGEVLSQEVEVPQATPSLEVSLRGEDSPDESLTWQRFTGTVKRQERRAQITDSGFESFGAGTRSLGPAIEVSQLALPLMQQGEDRSWQWRNVAEATRKPVETSAWPGIRKPLQPGPPGPSVQTFVVGGGPGPSAAPFMPDLPGGRQLLWVGQGTEWELASLPMPWLNTERGVNSEIDIAVRTELSEPRDFRTSITVRDESFASAVGFMTVGGLANAATMFSRARAMLESKAENPFAAAAGAYVLVSTQQSSATQNWYDWVRNLMNFFPWMPDGAIQYGRLKQLDESSDQDLDEARAALFQAYRRGLPFFSAGVRWLLNGLTILASDGDGEAEEMARIVHRVSLRTCMAQPFTVVRCGPRS